MRIYYFGCVKVPGHYMFTPSLRTDWDFCAGNPWGYSIDAGLCPKGPEVEGVANITTKNGWTALSFWDRSVDTRGKCNSSFLAEGELSFEEMVKLAREHFPTVMARFKFSIVEAPTATALAPA